MAPASWRSSFSACGWRRWPSPLTLITSRVVSSMALGVWSMCYLRGSQRRLESLWDYPLRHVDIYAYSGISHHALYLLEALKSLGLSCAKREEMPSSKNFVVARFALELYIWVASGTQPSQFCHGVLDHSNAGFLVPPSESYSSLDEGGSSRPLSTINTNWVPVNSGSKSSQLLESLLWRNLPSN
jgi:hypothetical protein